MRRRAMIGAATVSLWLASGVSAQTRSGGGSGARPGARAPGFSVLMPFRGGFVNVPLSPSGVPLVPNPGGCRRRPPPPPLFFFGTPAPLTPPPPPPEVPARRGFDEGYQVIAPRASNPQPAPSSGERLFVVPRALMRPAAPGDEGRDPGEGLGMVPRGRRVGSVPLGSRVSASQGSRIGPVPLRARISAPP